ncbi:MAG: COX15/CtaA family protein [Proteobacteria bacterium]|nr:COX15/CtaA family protein [Pseudomonadota bacterium]
MPFDEREFPGVAPDERAAGWRNRRSVAVWLFGVAAMIWVMIVLGGATRLTGSGLSIMEWAPFRGTLPPMSQAEWQRLFGLYREIPQFALVNSDIGIEGFKRIFWLEYIHRLWGRLIGFAFLLPLIVFWVQGRIERRLRPRLVLLFVLGGLQGAVGWFMVASGFLPDSTAVSPYRLVTHLGMALLLYAALIWTGLGVLTPRTGRTQAGGSRALRILVPLVCVAVPLTMLAGGFVAGLHAGLDYNTFPLMDGRLIPDGYARLSPWARNLTENIAAVQFDHRLLATATLMLATAAAALGLASSLPRGLRAAFLALGAGVAAQYALGVATLLYVVPVGLAVAHQAVAVLVLTASLVCLHGLRAVRPD